MLPKALIFILIYFFFSFFVEGFCLIFQFNLRYVCIVCYVPCVDWMVWMFQKANNGQIQTYCLCGLTTDSIDSLATIFLWIGAFSLRDAQKSDNKMRSKYKLCVLLLFPILHCSRIEGRGMNRKRECIIHITRTAYNSKANILIEITYNSFTCIMQHNAMSNILHNTGLSKSAPVDIDFEPGFMQPCCHCIPFTRTIYIQFVPKF